jgi:membrane fusion protein (multidrug efflux system)
MAHREDPSPAGAPRRRIGAKLGWILVGIAGVAVAVSFLVRGADDSSADKERKARATPVAVAAVEKATITERGRYPGELDADAADVSSFYTGRLTAVHVRVGDLVTQGQVVAEIDPVDAREQIARARAQAQAAATEQRRASIELDAARRQLDRFERLSDQLSASEIDAQRAKTDALRAAVATASARGAEAQAGVRLLQKRVVESEVRAPFAGRIAARHVDPGVIVNAGGSLVRVVAVSPLRIRFEVPEQDVAGLAAGTSLRVVTTAGASEETGASARVTGVAGEVERQRRVVTLEALIEAPLAGWLPGMFAEAVVDRRQLDNATVVPTAAVLSRLQPDGTMATGLLVADGEVARWQPVTVLAREGERAAVEPIGGGGLAVGANVLVAGHVDLGDGARIQVTGTRKPASAAAEKAK